MKKLLIATLLGLAAAGAQVQAKTLLVYYSFTGNIEKAADAVKDQTPTDVLRIQPAQKGLNYAANNYSLGSDLVDQIRSKPNDAFSYPAIDPVNVDFSKYDTVIIGTPLWWSNMAAPMQTFLFHNGKAMAGKKIGLIVSSAAAEFPALKEMLNALFLKATSQRAFGSALTKFRPHRRWCPSGSKPTIWLSSNFFQ